ncbi:DUF1353 domain-containing protein [Thalassotalea profundi]|uniref:DUF1353 domain-containing protein n=1 Tax=Thalassotalea profundi TaxID=2036687 RepID=A0ABQ3IL13_9GAMM|nr:DUF1353 domain-containing protein [Thalassotalea profundi]GHE87508.1 hypothetical protein GCM10011501_16240 [Thalassotalea profundi]
MLIKTNSRFIGEADTRIIKGEKRKVELLNDFAFIDKKGFEWFAPKGSIIDGSSIPFWLWTITGCSPFVGYHRLASIPHDVYCKTREVPHKNVHKMYFEACLLNGMNKIKATAFYNGLKIGAPRW